MGTSNDADLINSTDFRAKTTVNAEDTAVHYGSKNEEIEDLAARLPNRSIAILLLALFVKAVDLSDLTGLVIATNKNDPRGIPGTRQFANFL